MVGINKVRMTSSIRITLVLCWILDHPFITILLSSVLFVIAGQGIMMVVGYPSEHGDDIIDYIWGILLSIIATSVTAYVFMYESNRSLRSRMRFSEDISEYYERRIRLMLSCISVMTIVIVISGMILFPPFVNSEHENSVRMIYEFINGFSVSVMFCNLMVMLAIIQSGKVISAMSISRWTGVPSEMGQLEEDYKTHSYLKYLDHANHISKYSDSTMSVAEYQELVTPLSNMVTKVMEDSGNGKDMAAMPVTISSGFSTIEERLIQSQREDDSLGQHLFAESGCEDWRFRLDEKKRIDDRMISILETSPCDDKLSLYDIWTRDYLVLAWIINNKPEKLALVNVCADFGRHIAINNLIKTVSHYRGIDDPEALGALRYPYSSIVIKKMLFNKFLKDLDLTGSNLEWVSFYGSDLTGCNFTACKMTGCDLTNALLRNSVWVETEIGDKGIMMKGCDLTGAVFSSISLNDNTDIGNSRLEGSIINGPKLQGTFAISVLAYNITVNNGTFIDCPMDDSTLEGSILRECIIGRPLDQGIRISFGAGSFQSCYSTKARIKVVKGNTVLIDTRGPVEVVLQAEKAGLFEGLSDPKWKVEVAVCKAFCSLLNPQSDWESRPPYDVSLQFFSDGPERILIADLSKKSDGSEKNGDPTMYIDLIPSFSDDGQKKPIFGCDFEGSQFNDTRIWNSKVECANMRSIDIRNCSFFGSDFYNTSFLQTNFEKIDMANSITVRGQYVRCDFGYTKFKDADVENCDFVGCSISNVLVEDSIFDTCAFNNSEIHSITVVNCTFINNDLVGCKLGDGCYFEGCRFIKTDENSLVGVTMVDCTVNGKPVSTSERGLSHSDRVKIPSYFS